jgi:glycosyltransferase involved in cell wall biosynthesis
LRLLAIVPDPAAKSEQPGGALAAASQMFGKTLRDRFEVRVVDTSMRAFPSPQCLERLWAAAGRGVRTARMLLTWRPDVAIAFCVEGASYYEKSSLLMVAKAFGARVYLSPRSGFQLAWLQKSALGRAWVAVTGKVIDGFLMQSESWRDIHAFYGIRPEKLHVWHNSIDTEEWRRIAESREARSVERPFRFLFLGWAIPEKGVLELVEAAERLVARGGPSFDVALTGAGPCADALRARERQGTLPRNVFLLDWVVGDRRAEELRNADALVLPTWGEGFPNVILEAMACALPVIATPVGAIPEIVLDAETGFLVPVRSVDRLVDAMDRLRRDPSLAHRMGQRGLMRVRERFEGRLGLERLLSILEPHRCESST